MGDQFPPDQNSAKVDYVVPPESGLGEEAVNFRAREQQEKFLGGDSEQSQEQASLKSPEKVPDEQLTLKKAQTLFFLSYRFSQGSVNLQHTIFEYLHSLHPKWIISDELKEQLRIEVVPSIESHIRQDVKRILHRQAGAVNSNVLRDLGKMQEIFNRENTNPPSMLDIAKNIIDRDFRYLCEKDGRPRSPLGRLRDPLPKDATYNPQSDPLLSHICYYGLEENSTKVEEYDRMFRDVRKVILPTRQISRFFIFKSIDKRKKEMYFSNLDAVINQYAKTHPQSVPELKSLGFRLGDIA